MVGMWGDNVILELQNGRRVSVNYNSLRSESRIQAQQLKRELETSRQTRIKELESQSVAAAAPAPNPLPVPPAAPTYVPPKAGASVDQFLNQIETSINNGHLIAVYDALPPKYRSDVSELWQLAMTKIQPNDWQTLTGTLHELGDLIVTRQRWFLSSPRITTLPSDQAGDVEAQVLALGGFLRSGLDPEAMAYERASQTSADEFLKSFDQRASPYLAQLFGFRDLTLSRTVTVDSTKGTTASVTIDQGGKKQRVAFTQVDGYWVPKSVADGWDKNIAEMKTTFSAGAGPTMISAAALLVGQLSTSLSPMASAQTPDQFHGAMESMLDSSEPMVAMISVAVGERLSLAGGGSGGGYDSGYDSGYEAGYENMGDEYGGGTERMDGGGSAGMGMSGPASDF